MPEIALAQGTIEYEDTGGPGTPIVLLHGLLMNGSHWRNVVPALRKENRCIVPTLPLGAHRQPMRDDADLSAPGIARLVAEMLQVLDLRDVTVVGSDWGGAQLLVSLGLGERIDSIVLMSQEAFENYPPGLPGKAIALSAKAAAGLWLSLAGLRFRRMRRTPMTFGWMSKRPVPDEVMDGWFAPCLTDRRIRRDLRKFLLSTNRNEYVDAAKHLRSFRGRTLIVWAAEDRVMPLRHAHQLASLMSPSQLVEIADSFTLIAEDQPARLAAIIADFVREGARSR